MLGQQMPGALAALGHVRGKLAVEEHHRLRRHGAALGGAERQHIDAGFPGDLGRARVHPHQRVGKARAVHVDLHAVARAILASAAISSGR